MIDRAQVVATARAWIGTPFREQAHVRGSGCDCAGLLIGNAKDLGEVDPGFTVEAYKQSPDNGKLQSLLRKHLRSVPLAEMQPGDIVQMNFAGEPHHVGILVDYRNGLGIVHALKRRGKVVEHRLDSRWRSCITAAYKFPSVA
jgi:NlpC/P60 family putative phage cell wall peptidase